MAINVSTAGPYFTGTSPISFSQLRANFRAQNPDETFNVDNDAISISDFYRNTSATATNPQVPNSTENAGIPTSGEIDLSDFRNSIKYYYVTQTGNNTNVDLDNQNWNSNLNKNIRKFARMNGTSGSSDVTSAAVQFNATARNVTIEVEGSILGAGGAGGDTSQASGQNGGDALNVNSPSGFNNTVFVENSGEVFGGGGGGASGGNGGYGGAGGQQQQNIGDGARCQCCFAVVSGNGPGGAGGKFGAGGSARGYNYQSGSVAGQGGQKGQGGFASQNTGSGCGGLQGSAQSASGGKGGNGGDGGDGGNWGESGGDGQKGKRGDDGGNGQNGSCTCCPPCTGSSGGGSSGFQGKSGGSGGAGGNAISGGTNFTITGAQGSNTIKGSTF